MNVTQPERRGTALNVLAICLPLFAAMVVAKAFGYGHWRTITIRFPFELGIVIFRDLLFTMCWGVIAGGILHLTRRWRWIERAVLKVLIALSALMAVYAMINIWLCEEMRMPLTWPLLRMGGQDARSSISPYLTPTVILCVVGTPILYLASA